MSTAALLRPSVEEIEAEAESIGRLIERTTKHIDSSDSSLKQFLHLQLCRAEQQAYLAGLLYALGHPTILDRLEILYEMARPNRTECRTTR